MLTREQKEKEVAELHQRVLDASSVLAVDYRGLTVADAGELRRKLRDAGEGAVEYRVAKNTLMRRALSGTDSEGLSDFLSGPTALAFAFDEPSAVAKALVDFAKDNEAIKIKGGVVEGETVDSAQIAALAALPSKLELRTSLAGTLQTPLRNLAGTLNALLGHLRNALEQRQGQLEA